MDDTLKDHVGRSTGLDGDGHNGPTSVTAVSISLGISSLSLALTLCFSGAATLAVVVPPFLAYNLSPSPTFFNQAAAVIGWGGFTAATAWQLRTSHPWAGLETLLGLFMLVSLAALIAVFGGLPPSLSLSAVGLMLAAAVVALGGAAARAGSSAEGIFTAFCWGWIVAGLLSALVAIVQVFAPGLADGNWIAVSGLPGRAVGNLRQPNHLSSVLLWAMVALVVVMHARNRLVQGLMAALMALFVFGVVLSGSRTGMLAVGLLAWWGVCDAVWEKLPQWLDRMPPLFKRVLALPALRTHVPWILCGLVVLGPGLLLAPLLFVMWGTRGRLPWFVRVVLIALPIVYALSWAGMAAWAHWGNHTFGAGARLAESDMSGSRFAIWANAWELIKQQPLLGVGFGEFNFAWTLTPFEHRPTAFFDHTHNLPLQFLVELGVPLGLLALGLLAHALWRAWEAAAAAEGSQGVALRCAFVMLLIMMLHSQLEYPLWYAYFLLPTAWVFGYALGMPATGGERPGAARGPAAALVTCAVLVMAGGVWSVVDYQRVVDIFEPPEEAASLQERIAIGQGSVLFSHHADYAAATTTEPPSDARLAFDGATHYLLDTRLMIAWAKAYAERGQLDRARYIAQRLREFRKPEAEEFFAVCDKVAEGGELPFQCEAPKRKFTWRDFTR